MSKAWYPIINYDICIGCMACNDMCQHGVYKPNDELGKPKVVYGNGCIHGCHGCQKKCPVDAIIYNGDNGTIDIDYDFDSYKPHIECEGIPKVAFICNHNSCRSQIAEALGKSLGSSTFDSYSAGTIIKNQINQDAVRIMKNLYSIDMEETQFNKTIDDIPVPDIVIFMGCNVSCPNVPCQYAENWGLDDPSGCSDETFKETIQAIHERIIKLQEKITV